ncbi:MAG TPA: isochorismatase family protein [Chloroflexota bacterium]
MVAQFPSPAARLLQRGDATLVVIDMQARLVPVIVGAPAIVHACRRAIRAFDLLGEPVIFTEQYPRGLGPTVPDLAGLLGERQPISKTCFGCFDCAEFVQAVEQTGRQVLLLCGIEAHICVYQTALQALNRGFMVYLLTDAIGARTLEARRLGQERLQAAGAVVSHTEMAIYELLGTAGTAEFRSVLEIIKEEAEQ